MILPTFVELINYSQNLAETPRGAANEPRRTLQR
jgi:hypothetical protein